MTLRQSLVDAAIDEIRRELGAEAVRQNGTRVSIQGEFKMARAIEAVFRILQDQYPDEIEEKITSIVEGGLETEGACRDVAADSILTLCDYVIKELDPLP